MILVYPIHNTGSIQVKGDINMIFYFTATGNSLYVAKQLDDKRFSIPQELNKTNRHYKDDRIGIVCPLFEFDIPDLVKKSILG